MGKKPDFTREVAHFTPVQFAVSKRAKRGYILQSAVRIVLQSAVAKMF